MKSKLAMLILMAGVILMGAGSAQAYTINNGSNNGNLSDWGVYPSTGDWTPTLHQGIFPSVEDYVRTSDGFVNPGYGGQTFDMEAIYTSWDTNNLYIAIVTGDFPINTTGGVQYGNQWYSLGDIAIDFGVNGTYDYGIELGSHATSAHGYDGLNGTPGNIYATNNGNWSMVGGQATTGSFLASAPFYMNTTTAGPGSACDWDWNNATCHNIVEICINKSIFGSNWDSYYSLHLTQSCGNDEINVTTCNHPPAVPEPMSLSLLGMGLLGVIGAGIKRRK